MTKLRMLLAAGLFGLGLSVSGGAQTANAATAHPIAGYTHSEKSVNPTTDVRHRRGHGWDRGWHRGWEGRNCWQMRRVWNEWRGRYVWKRVNVCMRRW